MAEHRDALSENLLTMRNEKEGVDFAGVPKASVIESGDNGLARPGRHNHQVSVVTMNFTLCHQFVKDLALIAPRTDLERRELDRQVCRPAAFDGESLIEPSPLCYVHGVVRLERR